MTPEETLDRKKGNASAVLTVMTAGAKQRNLAAAALAVGEAGTLLLRAGTECENDRDNRAGAGITI
jgi:hypothetical protein